MGITLLMSKTGLLDQPLVNKVRYMCEWELTSPSPLDENKVICWRDNTSEEPQETSDYFPSSRKIFQDVSKSFSL